MLGQIKNFKELKELNLKSTIFKEVYLKGEEYFNQRVRDALEELQKHPRYSSIKYVSWFYPSQSLGKGLTVMEVHRDGSISFTRRQGRYYSLRTY